MKARIINCRVVSAVGVFAVLLTGYTNCSKMKSGFGIESSNGSSISNPSNRSMVVSSSSGLRPLTVREYDKSLESILGDTTRPGSRMLPEDTLSPFDNFIEAYTPSQARIRSEMTASEDIVQRLLADDVRLQKILPCIPKAADDAPCASKIVQNLGLKLFRAPLELVPESAPAATLTATFMDFAKRANSYKAGLGVVLRYYLQHPRFLYRWEIGESINGTQTVFQLTDLELASRLSFTLWGVPPDEALIDLAVKGELRKPEVYAATVERYLNDERAVEQADVFHSTWLGYSKLRDQSNITQMMRGETKALLKKVIFEKNSQWSNILTSDETYLTKELATHYGLPAPTGDAGWVKYNTELRRGILSQGAFLSIGGKFGDTSPIQRGYSVQKQLFCQHVTPPPAGIDVDMKPGSDIASPCKEAQHLASTSKPGTSCIGCHRNLDPVGFGLENFDAAGRFREVEPEHAECGISGNGEVPGYGKFRGPAALARIAVQSGAVQGCMVERWVQFTFGRKTDDEQSKLVQGLLAEFVQHGGKFKTFLKDFVMSADFKQRKTLSP